MKSLEVLIQADSHPLSYCYKLVLLWSSCTKHFMMSSHKCYQAIGSLSNHDDEGNSNPANLHIWQWQTLFLHALHVHFSYFDILKTFFFLYTTWNDLFCSCVDDVSIWWQMFNFVFLCPKRWFQFNSRIVRTHFSSMMTLNNWKMIPETRSYIFRWRSRLWWNALQVNLYERQTL